MGSITRTLFGGSESESQQTSSAQSGFNALPADIQNLFRRTGEETVSLLDDPNQFFQPQDLTQNEILAGNEIANIFTDPAAFGQTLQGIVQPFEQLVTQNINRDFEDFFNAANAATSQAGAFGSTRQNELLGDVERARVEALSESLVNPALGLRQQGLNDLLSFGGFERGIDLARRQALPQAIGLVTGGSGLGIIPSTSQSQGQSTSNASSTGGIIPAFSGG